MFPDYWRWFGLLWQTVASDAGQRVSNKEFLQTLFLYFYSYGIMDARAVKPTEEEITRFAEMFSAMGTPAALADYARPAFCSLFRPSQPIVPCPVPGMFHLQTLHSISCSYCSSAPGYCSCKSSLGPPFVYRCRAKEGGTLGTAALCRAHSGSRLGTDREHTGNRLVTLPSGNAIPTAIRAARGSAPNLTRRQHAPDFCPSASRVPAASEGAFLIPR